MSRALRAMTMTTRRAAALAVCGLLVVVELAAARERHPAGRYGPAPMAEEPSEPDPPLDPGMRDRVLRIASGGRGFFPVGTDLSVDFSLGSSLAVRPQYVLGGEVLPLVAADLGLSVSAELERLEPSLANYVKFRAAGSASFRAGAGMEARLLELDGRLLEGLQVEYNVRMPLEDYEALGVPNPFAPERLAIGTELMLEGATFKGHALEGTFRGVALQTEFRDWQGVAIGVEKIGPQLVRVVTGPTDGVRESLSVWKKLGKAFKLGLGRTETSKEYRLRMTELRLDHPAGRRAYDRLWLTGGIEVAGPGVARAGSVTKTTHLSETSLKAGVGSLTVNRELSSMESSVTEIRFWASGERTRELALRWGGNAAVVTSEFDRESLAGRSIDVVFRGLDGRVAEALQQGLQCRRYLADQHRV
ncbi:MAG: hypothetical protein HY554_00035 [Elusimicrobia bacterium]|nr:hypothetical protein [Elusimicrobiota bacterium]